MELTAEQYFRAPFDALMSADDMTSFTLLDDGRTPTSAAAMQVGELSDHSDHERSNTDHGTVVDTDDVASVTSEATWAGSLFYQSGSLVEGSDVLVARTQDVGLNSFACHTHLSGPRLGASGDILLGYNLECRNFGEHIRLFPLTLTSVIFYHNMHTIFRGRFLGNVF